MSKEKVVLLLGAVNREGATMALKATNKIYKHKLLDSSPRNWMTIIDAFNKFDITSVIAKINKGTLCRLVLSEYEEVRSELLKRISDVPHVLFCHETLITGKEIDGDVSSQKVVDDPLSGLETDSYEYYVKLTEMEEQRVWQEEQDSIFYDYYFTPPPDDIRNAAFKIFNDVGLTITPYRKNYEISLLSSSFIENQEHGLIFRLYVSSGKLWSNEVGKILQLFRDYLQSVSGVDVRQDQHRTNKGIVYEFFSTGKFESESLSDKFNEFTEFMDLCKKNPDEARLLLESKNLNRIEVFDILEKYSKEARRIHVDLKHERERAIMKIRHELESEISEYVRTEKDWQVLEAVIDQSVPTLGSGRILSAFNNEPASFERNSYTLNINPVMIDRVEGVVAGVINGDQHLSADARLLLEAINSYAGKDGSLLKSSLYELSDEQTKMPRKLEAKSRLLSFVLKIADKIGDAAAGVLQSYLESKIGI